MGLTPPRPPATRIAAGPDGDLLTGDVRLLGGVGTQVREVAGKQLVVDGSVVDPFQPGAVFFPGAPVNGRAVTFRNVSATAAARLYLVEAVTFAAPTATAGNHYALEIAGTAAVGGGLVSVPLLAARSSFHGDQPVLVGGQGSVGNNVQEIGLALPFTPTAEALVTQLGALPLVDVANFAAAPSFVYEVYDSSFTLLATTEPSRRFVDAFTGTAAHEQVLPLTSSVLLNQGATYWLCVRYIAAPTVPVGWGAADAFPHKSRLLTTAAGPGPLTAAAPVQRWDPQARAYGSPGPVTIGGDIRITQRLVGTGGTPAPDWNVRLGWQA